MNTKHIGKLKVTGRRLVVVTARIPGREDHALIVDTDSLRDSYLNSLMDVVTSKEAQEAQDLGTVLSRVPSPTQGINFLKSLHLNNFLIPVNIKDVIMLPNNYSPIPLEYVIKLMDGESIENITRLMEGEEIKNYEDDSLHNFAGQQRANEKQNKESIAFGILAEADRLLKESNRKKEEAYRVAPHLRPKDVADDTVKDVAPAVIPTLKDIIESSEEKPKRPRSRKK